MTPIKVNIIAIIGRAITFIMAKMVITKPVEIIGSNILKCYTFSENIESIEFYLA